MNRIQFLKRFIATLFGAAIIKQSKASVIPTEVEESKRYLLSATVAGTAYYAFPTVGHQLLEVEDNDEIDPDVLIPPSLPSFKEFPATLKLEPDNEFDYRAIAVYWNDYKMGYIPRNHNKVLYNLLRDGAELQANIRLVSSSDHASAWLYREPEDAGRNTFDDFQWDYDLRIRVYLVSENG